MEIAAAHKDSCTCKFCRGWAVNRGSPYRHTKMSPAVMLCSVAECQNEARYTSGFCGLHDIEFNDGRGTRWLDVGKP